MAKPWLTSNPPLRYRKRLSPLRQFLLRLARRRSGAPQCGTCADPLPPTPPVRAHCGCEKPRVQQGSTAFQQAVSILLKQEPLKIGHFCARPESALGAGGRAFKSPTPTNGVRLMRVDLETKFVEACGYLSYNFGKISLRLANALAFPLSAPAIGAGARRWLLPKSPSFVEVRLFG